MKQLLTRLFVAALLSLIAFPLAACSPSQSREGNIEVPGSPDAGRAEEEVVSNPIPQQDEEASNQPGEAFSKAEGKIAESSPAPDSQNDALDLKTPHYGIRIPAEERRLYVLEYSSDYDADPSGLAIGFDTGVYIRGENWPHDKYAAFSVTVFSDNWGPQGEFYSMPLGHPSDMPGATVYITQAMFDRNGNPLEDQTEEYAQWVEVL